MTNHNMQHFTLPPVKRDELHDDLVLALDAIDLHQPSLQDVRDAASYLRHALQIVRGVE